MSLLLALALVLAACSSDDSSSSDDGSSTTGSGSETSSDLEPISYPTVFLSPDGEQIEEYNYEGLPADEITEEWNVCAPIVHLKDPYWLALDYGLAQEAERTGTKLTVLAAGGYTELQNQISQMDDCVAQGADGIILGATSADGVVAKAEEIVSQGIPVVGIGVPVFSDEVPVAFASFRVQGRETANFMLETRDPPEGPNKVLFLPGPEGAGWPEDSLKGFEETVEGENVEIVEVKYGDTAKDVQLSLIEDGLQANPDIDYIVGNAVAATVAPQALREAGLEDDVQVIATYITPDVYESVVAGEVIGTVSDSTAMTGRIGYDILLRMLEGEDWLAEHPSKDIGPVPFVVSPDTLDSFEQERENSLPPDGYEPVFNVN
ncbi:MAG: TMAO reductase system periplasmic protein TorT [Acidimicrobiia bacterium]|nr:TMAO reductase system periplasmic protein TorT [Acidimicrobiia bacterium]